MVDLIKGMLDRYFVLVPGKLYIQTKGKLWTPHTSHTSSPRRTRTVQGNVGDVLLYVGPENKEPRIRNSNLPWDWWHMFVLPEGIVVGTWHDQPEIKQYPNSAKLGARKPNWCKQA